MINEKKHNLIVFILILITLIAVGNALFFTELELWKSILVFLVHSFFMVGCGLVLIRSEDKKGGGK